MFRRCSSTAKDFARASEKRDGAGEGSLGRPRETAAVGAERFEAEPEAGEEARFREEEPRRRSSRAPERRRVDADMSASRIERGIVAL